MSETTYSLEDCSLDALENDRIRSNTYVAFFTAKSQADADRFIYGVQGNGLSPSNPKPLIDARKELSEKGYIRRMNEGLRNVPFRSSVDPIINTIRSDIEKSGSYFDLKSEQGRRSVEALRKVLDSEWFRQFFSYHAIHNPYPGKHDGEFYSGYAGLQLKPYDFNGKSHKAVEVWYIKKLFLEIIAEIGTYSFYLNSFFEKNSEALEDYGYRSIPPEEIIKSRSFDDVVAKETGHSCRCWVDDFYTHVTADEKLVRAFITDVMPAFEIPKELHRRRRKERFALEKNVCSCEPSVDASMSLDELYSMNEIPRKVKFQKTRKNPPYSVRGVTGADISIPKAFIERVKYQSVCIPLSVAGIMRMSYPDLPRGIGERCHYAEWVMEREVLGIEKS